MHHKHHEIIIAASNGANIDLSRETRLNNTDIDLISEAIKSGGGNLTIPCIFSVEALEQWSKKLGKRLTIKI